MKTGVKTWLITILGFGFVGITMILLMPIGIVLFILSIFGLRKPMSVIMAKIGKAWAYAVIGITGCTLTVRGQENIPKKGGVCFVCNHGSIFDIVLGLAFFQRPTGFIAKKELAYIPFLDIWIWLIGGLYIDRKNIRKSLKTINTGVELIKKGGAMVIFPEGHRSREHGLLPFHPGSFRLAVQAAAPVVPVSIAGSYEVFEKYYRVRGVPITVEIFPPIETANMPMAQRKHDLPEQVYGIIKESLAKSGIRPS